MHRIRRLLPLLWLAAATMLLAGLLMGFAPLRQDGGLIEPWATIIFALAVPIIVQAVMFAADKWGKEPAAYIAQGLSLLLAVGYVLVTRGFAGLVIPIFPAWGGEILAFALALLLWIGLWVELLLAAGGSVEIAYRIVMKAVMERTGFAPQRKLAARAARIKAKRTASGMSR